MSGVHTMMSVYIYIIYTCLCILYIHRYILAVWNAANTDRQSDTNCELVYRIRLEYWINVTL